jgi:hypothetical protein
LDACSGQSPTTKSTFERRDGLPRFPQSGNSRGTMP